MKVFRQIWDEKVFVCVYILSDYITFMLSRWSGDVIWRTGKKNLNAVSHNRARP